MKKILLIILLIINLITALNLTVDAQLIDTISKNHYYNEEIFHDKYLDIYNKCVLTDISDGLN